MIDKIYSIWIYVSDLSKSIDFYSNKVGLKLKFISENEWAEFELGATSFAILLRPKEKGNVVPTKTRIMFNVHNIENFKLQAIANNIKLIGDVRYESYGKLLTFEDIDGHWLEVFENKTD